MSQSGSKESVLETACARDAHWAEMPDLEIGRTRFPAFPYRKRNDGPKDRIGVCAKAACLLTRAGETFSAWPIPRTSPHRLQQLQGKVPAELFKTENTETRNIEEKDIALNQSAWGGALA